MHATENTHEERDARKCEHQNEDGTLCNGWKVHGQTLCAGHLKLGIAADPRAYGAKGSKQSGENRSDRAEQRRKRAVDVYRDALDAPSPRDRRVTVAEAIAAARVDIALDDMAPRGDRLAAMRDLEARAIGKPTERLELEHAGRPDTLEEYEALSLEQRAEALRRLRAERDLRLVETDTA